MKQEPLKKPVPDVPVPFMADVNGYVIPDVVLTALLDVSTGTKRSERSAMRTEVAPAAPDTPIDFQRCCYPCPASDYNESPGDSVFGEPQEEFGKLKDLFRPLTMPGKNWRNGRLYD